MPNSSAYVVYKIGGDPSDYQFLLEAPKEISHGYACAYVPDCNTWALSNQGSTPSAITADQICAILKDQFGMMPKRKTFGYTKPYPNDYELIPLPPKYRLPDFTKFGGSDGSSSIEHVSRYLAQLGTISASDELRVRLFAQSLTGSAFGWYTSLPPNSIRTWKQLEEQFHEQYHSKLPSEKEAVELAVVGLSSSIKDVASQADYPSLAHMVQKLSAYEQRHPDVYQDKFKRAVPLVEADEDEGAAGDREVPEGHKIPTVQELNGKPYCKWHNTFTHTTNDCRVWRQQIQMAIENGRLIFNQYAMKDLDTTLVRTEMRAAALIAKIQRKPLYAIGSAKTASATSQREK
ncbi:hypothetical protein QYE76_015406 [Lolium multiflorum]|uniref:Retrotransposon gag domain-containing protein n=1 Tax=Lolium multiflorum TaxID=4521 RepID=A0AAD8U6I5_LOLMU|nr:hypothetical protein QYE76_015406 [Lolium multiflorum]